MVTNLKDIPIGEAKTVEDLDKVFQEHLGIGFAECTAALSESLQERADELLDDIINIAPYGDYDKVTEDKEVILKFLREESVKSENWSIEFIDTPKEGQLLELVFFNKSVDDGDVLKGFVFLGLSGKIRHAFVQISA